MTRSLSVVKARGLQREEGSRLLQVGTRNEDDVREDRHHLRVGLTVACVLMGHALHNRFVGAYG